MPPSTGSDFYAPAVRVESPVRDYSCAFCGKLLPKGAPHTKQAGVNCDVGGFFSVRMCDDCDWSREKA